MTNIKSNNLLNQFEIFQYIRRKDGIKTGIILGKLPPVGDTLGVPYRIGVAQFNPNFYESNLEILLQIARGRANWNPILSVNDERLTALARKIYPMFELRCQKYFKTSKQNLDTGSEAFIDLIDKKFKEVMDKVLDNVMDNVMDKVDEKIEIPRKSDSWYIEPSPSAIETVIAHHLQQQATSEMFELQKDMHLTKREEFAKFRDDIQKSYTHPIKLLSNFIEEYFKIKMAKFPKPIIADHYKQFEELATKLGATKIECSDLLTNTKYVSFDAYFPLQPRKE